MDYAELLRFSISHGSIPVTLPNRIRSGLHGHKIAVIENEFGGVGDENQFVVRIDEETHR